MKKQNGKKKELKINVTCNQPSKEALARFAEKAMELYEELVREGKIDKN